MSSNALYDYSVNIFISSIQNLLVCMTKAEKYAEEQGDNVDDYVQLQIHPDMKNFAYQIQRISDSSKGVLARIAGHDAEAMAMPDTETTWADLKTRLNRTLTILEKSTPQDFEGKEGVEVSLLNGRFNFKAAEYLQRFAIPNVYFHVVTAYDLLRMKGVPVGKMDYLAGGSSGGN
ncbi:hypothetical protein LTS08_002015 [Lithohypha guttulata]|uniref:DUF1993 domain-containing protein n=1 Tax=Lithohypha guttulata TaxID=1690604 RepID=A0AAN7YA78_9EURO|nr:hypothetical protein LTR51_004469 [Lithohypha guttulata]KAK5091077.1 hypothetical protein LTR05_001257 [Lithohypha guttulata]KAK5104131.1 hypothetical protein LTS08_002015 [Lithohypha guttulata]